MEPTVSGREAEHRYDGRRARHVERSWQRRWADEGVFEVPNPVGPLSERFADVAARSPFYILDMFPYPSGDALHVGHPLGYVASDVYARYHRMLGKNVLHAMGFDAFGLPAEQYAIETGQHPAATTAQNIATMRKQLSRLGLGHDHRRTIVTSDPEYYRWTQWIFLRLYQSWYDPETRRVRPIEELEAILEDGLIGHSSGNESNAERIYSEDERRAVVDSHRLAYRANTPVNWCPGLGTVLADEEVTDDGVSDRGGHPVYRRPLRQWLLRITALADRLLEDLDELDWPENVKEMQRNWIGRSEGLAVDFTIDDEVTLEVFTTKPETLMGVTFLAVSPDHAIAERLAGETWHAQVPAAWRGAIADTRGPKEALSRLREAPPSTDASIPRGVFLQHTAEHPVTLERLPVFACSYVSADYATGCVMGVPAHDDRDRQFAALCGLPSKTVIQGTPGQSGDRLSDGPQGEQPPTELLVVASGHPDGPDIDGLTPHDARQVVASWAVTTGVGRRRVAYRLRDWLFSRQRYWGEPFPIVYDDDGRAVPIPEHDLPVKLPPMEDFRPSPAEAESNPTAPLERAEDWVEVELDLGNGLRTYRRDTNTMPQWAGSCWYYLRYLDPSNGDRFVAREVERYWMASGTEHAGGVDLYLGGVEHAVLHLLYARFWHKVLYGLGEVSTPEPFQRLVNQGYVLAPAYVDDSGVHRPTAEVDEQADGSFTWRGKPVFERQGKMGKSLKNAVSPDRIYEAYGADTLRLYLMSMGPLWSDRSWDEDGITGPHRFLQRVWRNVVDEATGVTICSDAQPPQDLLRQTHVTIEAVARDMNALRFNTAIAHLTALNNSLVAYVEAEGYSPRSVVEPIVLMLAPFAPHVAEELWRRIGHRDFVVFQPYPSAAPEFLGDGHVEIPVQVDGRLRAVMVVEAGTEASALRELALNHPAVERWVADRKINRIIALTDEIVNVVTRK